jgi:RNA polymerase sigma factor (sigma-70 family)
LRGLALGQGCAELTDGQLLELFLSRRDDVSFEALLRRHGPMVLGVCRRILRNEADAEDAFQATFLVLVRKAASIVPRGMVGNWLYGVAHNTARKAKAMNSKRRARERAAGTRPRPEPPADDWQKLYAVLDDELSRLPEKYRAPIVLCELEGKPIKEAARQLGWAQGTLAGRLSRGRRLLAGRVARHGLTLSAGVLAALAAGPASAGVPAALFDSTVQAAAAVAAGQAAAAGVVPAHVALLTEGVVKSMFLTKMKIVTALALVALALGTGAGEFAYRSQAAQDPVPANRFPPQTAPAREPGQRPPNLPDEARLRRVLDDLAKQARDLEAKAAAIKADLEALRRGDANRQRLSEDVNAQRLRDLGVLPLNQEGQATQRKKQEADRAIATAVRDIEQIVHKLRESTQDPNLEIQVLGAIEQAVGRMRQKAGGRDPRNEPRRP